MFALINFVLFLLITSYAVYLFASLVYSRVTYIKLGVKSNLQKDVKVRINEVLTNVFGQRKLLKDKKSGIMHVVMFYGFIILQFGALEIIIKGFVKGFEWPIGLAHHYFSLVQEITTFLVMIAVFYAYYRRYIEKLNRLKRGLKPGLVIIFLSALVISIFMTLSFEHVWVGESDGLFSPISTFIAHLLGGLNHQQGEIGFYVFWWIHLITLLSFLVYIPQSKHAHLLFAPVNVLMRDTKPLGKLHSLDFEDETIEEYGVGSIEGFRQNQLIDLYACVECGRCTDMCPASLTGKTLSPMNLIIKMRDHLTEKDAEITKQSPFEPSFLFDENPTLTSLNRHTIDVAATKEKPKLIGDIITEEELWSCTTCRSCEDQCPVANEHVDKIIDMRRYLVLTEGKVPQDTNRYFQNLERQSNPWGINRNQRMNWRDELIDISVPTVKEVESFDYLFFVGSMGSFDKRSQKIAQSFVRIMHKAGIKFAILGNEERSSGETARRMGNEFLFQQLCMENIKSFKKYHVKKIVTICPHTYNTFKNEYPEFGLEAEVYHHTELIWSLIEDGRLVLRNEVNEKIAYHDSCYIGRYNQIYDIPRQILECIPGIELMEMSRNRENAMCCGAGGGMMWLEEKQGKRINVERTEQALILNPTVIGSNCPYCLSMMNDGVKMKDADNEVKTLDITEIVERAL
ncbi:4Fe-4S dicluster domain-containing protein [Terrilactibacillus sp. BCM23-1]|uniref:4Fe-4S dicluster domain-containing protein n=1 Tax=Terrilactibacillus tamarindi TaxID=2599694 RepID=A0A6N8CQ83_9BACI|nr:(Fe-S)-binding protein [Terrilactibacillus tamarindi]MTT31810.1 4Fe-4S dicluster domain-containing protein [Terrilactibacillus tamarindi]